MIYIVFFKRYQWFRTCILTCTVIKVLHVCNEISEIQFNNNLYLQIFILGFFLFNDVLKYRKTTCSGKFIIEEFYFALNLLLTNIFINNNKWTVVLILLTNSSGKDGDLGGGGAFGKKKRGDFGYLAGGYPKKLATTQGSHDNLP